MGPAGSVCIFLLGRFEVTRGERLLHASTWTRRKAAALLQRLAFERRLLKEQAIEFLWPEHDPTTGANNLYRTLHALRQTLDMELGAGATEATFAFHDGVLTLADNVWVDVAAFESLAQSNDQADLIRALRRYTGDFLPDERYAEWTLVPRAALTRKLREVRLRLATQAREEQRYHEAITLLTPLLTHDPADEVVHRELMTLYALAGRRHEALRQYQTCIEAFDRYLAEHQRPPEEHPITHFKWLGVSDPQREQGALFNAAVTFLLRLAAQRPVVLLVDDLHA